MKPSGQGYRVAVVGASTLLGKELLRILEERNFPISRLVTFEADQEEPDLPIVDFTEQLHATVADEDITASELDIVFLAARPGSAAEGASFLHRAGKGPCVVIDMADGLGEEPADSPGGVLSIPFLERTLRRPERSAECTRFISAHPAVIVLSGLLLRLAARFALKSAVAQIFDPVSEHGSRAIEELQKQTVNLLSFQKIPQSVFGGQLAFNVLPRLGGEHAGALADLDSRIRRQVRQYLGSRAPLPAIRVCQAPVFYSLAFSLYVETAQPVASEALSAALAAEGILVRRRSEPAPSQVEAAGSGDILVDAITVNPENPAGIWIWAVVDNIRLAAMNAVDIAESLPGVKQPPGREKRP
jgi:aspartate-semialdehyde dehydrogenase